MAPAGESHPAPEMPHSDRLLELASAVLLALATVASAWCVYQSERWSGVQQFRLNDSDTADRQASEMNIKANHDRLLDAITFMRFTTALEQDNKGLQQFYLSRFRPEMRAAVDAWLATQPLTNPNAPSSPFAMPEYRVPRAEEAQAAREKAAQQHDAAVKAKQQAERYTFLTVLLASVFFFAGIATHFEWPRIKVTVFLFGIIAFLGTMLWLTTCLIAP